jgi:hypothetical protein
MLISRHTLNLRPAPPPPGALTPATQRPRPSIGMDIVRRPQGTARAAAVAAAQAAQVAARHAEATARRAVVDRPRVVTPHRRLNLAIELLQYPLIAAAALGAAYSSSIGQWLVLAYAVVVLVTRRSSRLSFGVALFLLITIPFFQALGQSGAIYTYELLVVGTIQALMELRKTGISANSSMSSHDKMNGVAQGANSK